MSEGGAGTGSASSVPGRNGWRSIPTPRLSRERYENPAVAMRQRGGGERESIPSLKRRGNLGKPDRIHMGQPAAIRRLTFLFNSSVQFYRGTLPPVRGGSRVLHISIIAP